jgi:hypothetical protein
MDPTGIDVEWGGAPEKEKKRRYQIFFPLRQ